MSKQSANDLLERKLLRSTFDQPSSGVISDHKLDEPHTRWKRVRQWDKFGSSEALILPWICLNPAGNAAEGENKSLRPFNTTGTGWNMIVLSWRWGFDGCIAYNVFPFENKDPDALGDWLGVSTQKSIAEANSQIANDLIAFDAVMTAWGRNRHAKIHFGELASSIGIARSKTVGELTLWRLRANSDGSPRHPGQGTRHDWLPENYAKLGSHP